VKKQKRQTTFKQDTGKLLQDIGKLVFGSIFLGGVLRGEVPQTILLISGFIGATVFCLIGLILAVRKKETGDIKIPEKQE